MIVYLLQEPLPKLISLCRECHHENYGHDRHKEQHIREFKNEEFPNIVVTVDLLTTGIDVPSIMNLVFMRRVKSRILFEQMIGRATRCSQVWTASISTMPSGNLPAWKKSPT